MANLYYFNPDHEISVAYGKRAFTLPANIRRMVDELSWLPAWYAESGDYVLVKEMPDYYFLQELRELLGIDVEPILYNEAMQIEFEELKPWGWNVQVDDFLNPIIGYRGVIGEYRGSEDYYKELCSRKRAMECLRDVSQQFEMPRFMIPTLCHTIDDVCKLNMEQSVVVKSPWSSSGRGILMLEGGAIKKREEEWINGVLRKQGYVMVEKRLDKVFEFAFEYIFEPSGDLQYLGLSEFYTGTRGEYRGNYIGEQRAIKERIFSYISEKHWSEIKVALERRLITTFKGIYHGALGVDMMIWRDRFGNFQLQPCIELNMRYNMGIVAISIYNRFIAEGSYGLFSINYNARSGEALRVVEEKRLNFPVKYKNKKIVSGYLNLTPVTQDSAFWAEILIE